MITSSKSVSTSLLPRRTLQRKQNRLGPYDLLQTLGEGEFGKVKLGVHTETGQEVAIKLIKKTANGSGAHINKVEREISVLKTLHHPYIVKLYSVVETEKYIGLILKYASGGELFEYILAHKYLKEEDAKRFFAQLISSVKYMHDRNIVHRDLKLENILLDKDRNIIVTDFGFANQFESESDDLMATTCGSPCYAAPELVINTGLYAGSAVDIWSCGVILYAMLCGFLPFDDDPSNPESDNINQLYRYILSTHVIFPPHIKADVRDLLEHILVTDPTKRCSLDYILHHPWLAEYHAFLKLDPSQIKSKSDSETPRIKEKPNLVINTSMSAVVQSRNPIGSGGGGGTTRRGPRISLISHDRFAPVANDKYQKNLETKAKDENGTKTSTFKNFAIRKQYNANAAATANSPVHTTPVLPPANKTSKFSTLITRKPIPRIVAEDGSSMTIDINPEKSLSSPLSLGQENKHTITLGGVRNQQRGADKFLSFFTGAKVVQAPSTTEIQAKESNDRVTGSNDDDGDKSGVVVQQHHTLAASTTDSSSQNTERICSESDVSTINVSVPSLALSEDAVLGSSITVNSSSEEPNTPDMAVEPTTLETIDEHVEVVVTSNNCPGEQCQGHCTTTTTTTTPSLVSQDQSRTSTTTTSGVLEGSSIRSSNTTNLYTTQKDKSSLSTLSRDSSRTHHHYDMSSIKSSSTAEKDTGVLMIQPEVSSSTRLYAVGESGRKAIAAVRRSMTRKTRGIMQNQHHLDTIPDEDNCTKVTNKDNKLHVSFEPLESRKAPEKITPSMSESPGKKKVVKEGPETVSKKSGMKMMGWIKKRSQGKEVPQKIMKINEPTPSTSTKIKTEKRVECPIVSEPQENTSNTVKNENKEPNKSLLLAEIPEQNNTARRRNRAHSGNDTILLKKSATHADTEIQIHQGAIDRNALTSQSPALIIKDALRILRILGIEATLEGNFVIKCHRQKSRVTQKKQPSEGTPAEKRLEPIYGDASVDNGNEIRFVIEICRFENLPGLYIVDVRRLKGNAWAFKFLYHKLIDFLYFDKNGYL